MSEISGADIFKLLFWLTAIVWVSIKYGPYFWEKLASQRWPVISAEIQRGGFGSLPGAKGAGIPASFFGYRFTMDNVPRVGIIAVPISEEGSKTLQERLAGERINVKYDPRNPDISCLVDKYDFRFNGGVATQQPDVLDCAPEFHISDAAKR